ncbi:MAG: VOC family protein [Pleomorphochaeta sp.]
MEFTNMDHITINVVDLEKTLWFYGELLELKSLPLVEFETETIYYFQLPGSIKLELIDYKDKSEKHELNGLERGIFRHLAFNCDNVFEVEDLLTKHGFSFHVPVSFNEKLGFYGGLTKDPNGVELEFLQYK